jgi:predicted PurR-regulated permease PerM
MNREDFQKTALLIVVIGISILFFTMIRRFLMTLLLAGIFAGMLQWIYHRFLSLFGERRSLASGATLLVFVLIIVAPLAALLSIVVEQALQISRSAGPWIEQQIRQPDELYEKLRGLPGFDLIEPYRDDILARLAGVAGAVGNFVVQGLSAATSGTVSFFFHFFIFLYALYFLIKDGQAVLQKAMYYLPLSSRDEARLVGNFKSVARATVKGTLVIGLVQGVLAGIGLAVAGIGGAVFWGSVMVVLSVIPAVGTSLVWIPASLYLAANGSPFAAILLALYCGLIVGSMDNILRPRLVGKDTKMPDLLILLSTLGGIFLFGVPGFIIGPIVAALFLTAWDIYGAVFRYALVDSTASSTTASSSSRRGPRRKPQRRDSRASGRSGEGSPPARGTEGTKPVRGGESSQPGRGGDRGQSSRSRGGDRGQSSRSRGGRGSGRGGGGRSSGRKRDSKE